MNDFLDCRADLGGVGSERGVGGFREGQGDGVVVGLKGMFVSVAASRENFVGGGGGHGGRELIPPAFEPRDEIGATGCGDGAKTVSEFLEIARKIAALGGEAEERRFQIGIADGRGCTPVAFSTALDGFDEVAKNV